MAHHSLIFSNGQGAAHQSRTHGSTALHKCDSAGKHRSPGTWKSALQRRSFLLAQPWFGIVLACLFALAGCVAPPIKPQAAALDKIHTVLVVPVESPPLEVTPDLIDERIPAYRHYRNMAIPLDLKKTVYEYPGGILIAGLTGPDDVIAQAGPTARTIAAERAGGSESAASLSNRWTPTRILAEEAISQLRAAGLNALPSETLRPLTMPIDERNGHVGNWQKAVRRWYEQSPTVLDYANSGADQVDAVMEIAVGNYRIFEGQTSLTALIKLVDPKDGRIIARTDRRHLAVEDSASALLDHDASKFKRLVAMIGSRAVKEGLGDIGLTAEHRPPGSALARN